MWTEKDLDDGINFVWGLRLLYNPVRGISTIFIDKSIHIKEGILPKAWKGEVKKS